MQKQLQENGNRIIRTVAVLLAVMLLAAAVVTGGVTGQASSVTTLTTGGIEKFTDLSIDFTYNGALSEQKLRLSQLKDVGDRLVANTAEYVGSDGYEIIYYSLPAKRSTDAYLSFSEAFSYTDLDGETHLYDVKIYLWAPDNGETDNVGVIFYKPGEITDGIDAAFGISTTYFMDCIGNSTTSGPGLINMEWHFYEHADGTGLGTEVSVSGLMWFDDNDENEGWAGIQGVDAAYALENTYLDAFKVTGNGTSNTYFLGTKPNTSAEESELYMTFTSTPSKPLIISYCGRKTACTFQSKSYTITYNILGDIPDGVDEVSTKTISRFVNTTNTNNNPSNTASMLFADLSAAGYTWEGWYNTSSWTSSTEEYSGVASTQANVKVYGRFTKKVGNLTITKTLDTGDAVNADTELSGFAFHLVGTSASGEEIDLYAVTDSDGKAYFTDVPVCAGSTPTNMYKVYEVSYSDVETAANNSNSSAAAILSSVTKDPDDYVMPSGVINLGGFTYAYIGNGITSSVSWKNTTKQWRITVTKMDSSIQKYATPYSGLSLEGAVYGLYDASGTKIAEYTTDENGQFTTDYYVCCDGWYIQEITPSFGYNRNTTKYYIDASSGNFTEQYNEAGFTTASSYDGYDNVVLETKQTVTAVITKNWSDDNNSLGVRPSTLTVYLYRKSDNVTEEYVTEKTLTVSSTAASCGTSVTGLDKYDSLGAAYEYYWEEDESALPSTDVNGQKITYYLAGKSLTNSGGSAFITTLTNSTSQTSLYADITIEKTVDDSGTGQGDVSGWAFYLSGTSVDGDTVEIYAVTDSDGKAVFLQVPYSDGSYTITEVSAGAVQTAANNGNTYASEILSSVTKDLADCTSVWSDTVEVDSPTAITLYAANILKSWYITVTKMDSALKTYGGTQDGYSLKNAEYGLYDADDNLIKTYYTDANGQFTTDCYVCCEGWYIKEISASAGYEVDETEYVIDASGDTITSAGQAAYFTNASTVGTYRNVVFENPELVSVHVTKIWDDNNDEMGVRPSKLTVTLYRSSANVAEDLIDSVEIDIMNATGSNTWEISMEGLVKYDLQGAEYTYYWKEETLPASYDLTVDGIAFTADGYSLTESTAWDSATETWNTSLTNSITVMIPVTVTKTWDDDADAQKVRPDEICVLLYSSNGWLDVNGDAVTDETTTDTALVLDAGSNWSAQAVVPKYDSMGTELEYKFTEVTSTDDIMASASGVPYPIDYIWADGVKKYLSNLDVSWYTGDPLTGYVLNYEYDALSTGTKDTQTTITNEHTPNKDITLTEIIPADDFGYYFDDYGDYPSFTFELKDENGTVLATQVIEFTQDYVAANTDGDGDVSISVTFERLTYGTYTITKTVQAEKWEIVSVDAENGTVKQEVVTEFGINSSNVSESSIVLVATYKDSYNPKAEITVTKKIDIKSLEQYGLDSEFVFTLERSDGTAYTKTAVIAASTGPSTADKDGYVSVTVTFSDLEYGYTYVLEESGMPEGWAFVSVSATGGTITDGGEVTFGPVTKANAKETYAATYTNEYILGTITIIKYGNRNNLLNGVEYTLYYPDGTVAAIGTTGEDGDGTLVFKDLVKGIYTLTETSTLDGYSLLADEIIAEIPLTLTDAEYAQYQAAGIIIDVSAASSYLNGVYTFTDLTYTISDTANLTLPTTGNAGTERKVLLAIFVGLVVSAATAVGISLKKEITEKLEEDLDAQNRPDAEE